MARLANGRRVAVALCTFNGARFLNAQLHSIARQTRLPDEMVAVDDGSSDVTLELLRAFAAAAPFPVRIEVNQRRLGTAANFEKALSLCCDGVALLADQDDVWLEHKIERMLQAFDEQPAAMLVHSDAIVVDESLQPLAWSLRAVLSIAPAETAAGPWSAQLPVMLRRNVVTGCTAALDTRLLALARPFPPGWLHDEWLALVAAAHGAVAAIDDGLLLYRQHGDNQLGVARHRGWRRLAWLLAGRADLRSTFVPRLEAALAHLKATSAAIDPAVVPMVAAALAFARDRAALPPNRLLRLPAVARQWRAGAYARHGRGWRTAVVDLVEPINKHV